MSRAVTGPGEGGAPPARPSAIPGYEDWPAFQSAARPRPGELAGWLGVPLGAPADLRAGRHWCHAGLDATEYTWSVGFGPRARGVLLRPAAPGTARLPGILALHCHGGRKFRGLEKLVESGPDNADFSGYEGQALANYLAARGAAVFVPDAFTWGSRRFALDRDCPLRAAAHRDAERARALAAGEEWTAERDYDAAAAEHEHTVAKVAGLLGTSFAGLVAYDDLLALEVFASLGVASSISTCGFSGGGGRALVLAALDARVRAASVACMMTTFESLLPAYTDAHSWLLQTPHLARHAEWPQLAARADAGREPRFDLQVLQGLADPLFPEAGMRAAERILRDGWPRAGRRLDVRWYAGGHVMTREMQSAAGDFLLGT
ncbi:acetylesterase [Micrococcales bacterium 31B]|nr:acetylesterase [Micrococcales bacterium 31B]